MQRFEFQFRLTEDQFREAHRAYLRQSLVTVKNLFLVTIALMIGMAQTQLFGAADWVLWVFGSLWLAVVGLSIFVYIWMPSRIYRARAGLSETQTVVVDEEGLDWKTGEKHRLIAWKELDRASDLHPAYVYFHPRHGMPDILPKSAFQSDEELTTFDRFVQKCLHPEA